MQRVCKFYSESRKDLQDTLNAFSPTNPDPRFKNYTGLLNSLGLNYYFLSSEIFCRSFLLVDRCARCAYATSLCAYSILCKTVGKTPSSFDYKGYFCQEFRYLAAESFELVGVVACSILLLPFNRNSSSPPVRNLLHAQIWIEKTAERISGERKHIDSIQPACSEKETLFQMKRILGFEKEERESWKQNSSEFNQLAAKIAPSKRRRIARNYLPEPALSSSKEKLQSQLPFFRDFVSDESRMDAINKQKKRLISLKSLMGDLSPSTTIQDSASKDEKLKHFNELSSEIEKMIAKLHTIHDPENTVQQALESLGKDLDNAYFGATAFSRYRKASCWATRVEDYYNRFFFVYKKFDEIQFMYSYQDIEDPLTFQPKDFIDNILKEISACQILFNEKQSWKPEQKLTKLSLNRQKALAILGLDEEATPETIKKTYKKLALIHHPDKGGSEEIFKILNNAYAFLIEETSDALEYV